MSQSPPCRRIWLLPCKRLLAIDPGSHCLKLLLVEESLGRIRVRHRELIEVQAGGLLSEEESLRHAQDLIQELGNDPVALALPHDRAISQLVDLPPADATEARRLIEEETVKLSGLGESNIVFDYTTLKPFGKHPNPFWVTLCREEEVQRQVDRCGLGHVDLCEVTTTANALIAAGLAAKFDGSHVALVDFGATGTTIAILHHGQAVEATQFPIGGNAITEALASRQRCSLDVAESLKRTIDLTMESPDASAMVPVLAEWHGELCRILSEWLKDQSGDQPELLSFRVVLSGGAALQPGLCEFLNQIGPLVVEPWPADDDAAAGAGSRFAVVYGAAIQAIGRSRQPVSLLPAHVREFWRGHHSVNLLHSLIVFLLALSVLALGFGSWQKWELIAGKQTLLEQSRTALGKAQTIEDLSLLLHQRYERLQPGLERQQGTLDALKALALLQMVRTNQNFWFVLLSDVPSYVTASPWGETNASPANSPTTQTTFPIQHGFVAEVCLPERGEAMRRTLSQLVTDLRNAQLFANVDLLPPDRRRPVVDTSVILPDQHFTLALELPLDRIPKLPPLPERRPDTNAPGMQRRASADPSRSPGKPPAATQVQQP